MYLFFKKQARLPSVKEKSEFSDTGFFVKGEEKKHLEERERGREEEKVLTNAPKREEINR